MCHIIEGTCETERHVIDKKSDGKEELSCFPNNSLSQELTGVPGILC